MKNFIIGVISILLIHTSALYAWNIPSIASPADGADTWSGVTLNWNAVANSQQYEWQADTSADFNSPAFQGGTKNYINTSGNNSDTEHFLTNTYFGATYYWRVRAYIAGDTSDWNLRTIIIRNYVNLTSPANGADVWSGVTLDWGVHTGIAQYHWQADTSADFNSPALQFGTNNYINSTDGNSDTRHFLVNTYFGKTYYWRVRVTNAVDTSAWSEVRTVNIRNYVTMSTPANGAVNRSVAGITLNWVPHNGVSHYQMQLDSTGLFNGPYLQNHNKAFINSTNGNSDTQQSTGALAANTIYFWRVRARNAVDTCAWTTWTFSTGSDPIVLPQTPSVLIAPADGSTLSGLSTTIVWNSVPGVTTYYYEYSIHPNFTNPQLGIISDTSAFISGLNAAMTYYWRVLSVNGSLTSEWSETWSFTASAGTITTANVTGGPFCSGSAVDVSFTLAGSAQPGNVFTVQLSNATGSFNAPVSIGTIAGTNDGMINALLPLSTATGSGYRVRVVSSSPLIIGEPTAQTFEITQTPDAPAASVNGVACEGEQVTLNATGVSGADYSWTGPSNFSSNQQNPELDNLSSANEGQYFVAATVNGCTGTEGTLTLTVNPNPPTPSPASNSPLCSGDDLLLQVAPVANADYAWSGPGGFSSAQQNPVVSDIQPTDTGNYFIIVTVNGCSSQSSVLVNVSETSLTDLQQTICDGETFAGYAITGFFVDTFQAMNGCDSIRTLSLTVLQELSSTVNQTICQGQSFAGYNSSGTYVDVFPAGGGCDSTRTLHLTVLPDVSSIISQTICQGQSFAGYTTSGNYVDVFQLANGCDSLRTLNLSVVQNITTTINQMICQGQSFAGYNSSGTYVDVFASSGGCDSTRTLNLTVTNNIATTVTQTICAGETFAGYDATGAYTDTFQSSGGCDSTRTLNLFVTPEITVSESAAICAGDSILIAGAYQTQAGLYSQTFTATGGCDNVVTTTLTVNVLSVEPTIVFVDATTLSVPDVYTQYQWFENNTPVSGANQPTYNVMNDGDYFVQVTDANGCSAFSNTETVVVIGIAPASQSFEIRMYPNPVETSLLIEFSNTEKKYEVRLTDFSGKIITQFENINASLQLDMTALNAGVYLVYMRGEKETVVRKVVKM